MCKTQRGEEMAQLRTERTLCGQSISAPVRRGAVGGWPDMQWSPQSAPQAWLGTGPFSSPLHGMLAVGLPLSCLTSLSLGFPVSEMGVIIPLSARLRPLHAGPGLALRVVTDTAKTWPSTKDCSCHQPLFPVQASRGVNNMEGPISPPSFYKARPCYPCFTLSP